MRLKKIIFIILTFLSSHIFWAQVKTDSLFVANPYIKSTLDHINVKFDIESNGERFDLKGSNFEYDIRPNISSSSRLSVNYMFISLSYSYVPLFIPGNNDDALKGKTRVNNFGLQLNFNHWNQELQYGKVTGFYLENSQDFLNPSDTNNPAYILVPDLKVVSFRGATSYKFNTNFSQKAISTQTEIQLKSAGSFIPGVLYNYYLIDNKSNDPSQQTSQKSKNFEFLANFGYYYTLVLNKRWYSSLGIAPSIGINYTNLLTRYPDEYVYTNFSSALYRINGKAGLGYNGERFFGGLELSSFKSFKKDNSPSVTIASTYFAYQFFIGYRFNAPKKLKTTVESIQSKSPL